jgi:hypothetical protein
MNNRLNITPKTLKAASVPSNEIEKVKMRSLTRSYYYFYYNIRYTCIKADL